MSFPPLTAIALAFEYVERWVPKEPKLKTPHTKGQSLTFCSCAWANTESLCSFMWYSKGWTTGQRNERVAQTGSLISSFIDTWCSTSFPCFSASQNIVKKIHFFRVLSWFGGTKNKWNSQLPRRGLPRQGVIITESWWGIWVKNPGYYHFQLQVHKSAVTLHIHIFPLKNKMWAWWKAPNTFFGPVQL